MDSETTSPASPAPNEPRHRVTIIGVGTAGGAMLEFVAKDGFAGARFVWVNAEATGPVPGVELVHLESKRFRGLGTGGDPERGRKLAEEEVARLQESCAGAEVVFLLTGLGGGTGSGASPVLARVARKAGALVLAFVTLPFDCEGNRRQTQAQQGLEQLRPVTDGVICLPNQKAFQLMDEHTSLLDAFRTTAQLLVEGARGVWRLLMHRGLIEIHFEELCTLLREHPGESCFATVESAGTTRARDAIEKLPAHPLLDGGQALKDADTLLVSLLGGPDLSMADVNRVMQDVNQHCGSARVIVGAAVEESFRDRLAVTIIATRRSRPAVAKSSAIKAAEAEPDEPEFETELLHPGKPERPGSRVVPPAPALTAEQRNQILAGQTGKAARGRKTGSRLKQTTLPLDIVNKGRFDKSEPTIHKGEDLDLPTYIRRGVSLN